MIMFDEEGKCDAIQYDFFIPILVSEVQRLYNIIDTQNSEIVNLKSELSSMKSTINSILETINNNN